MDKENLCILQEVGMFAELDMEDPTIKQLKEDCAEEDETEE